MHSKILELQLGSKFLALKILVGDGLFTGQVEVSEGCVLNERSGRGTSLWVCLLWSVGASDVVCVWA